MQLEASEEGNENEQRARDQRKDDQFKFEGKIEVIATAFDDRSKVIVIETIRCCHCGLRAYLALEADGSTLRYILLMPEHVIGSFTHVIF